MCVCVCRHYNAVVDMVSEDGETCTVTFDGYGSTEIIKLADLRPQGWEEDGGGGAKGAGPMKKKKVSEPNAKYVAMVIPLQNMLLWL